MPKLRIITAITCLLMQSLLILSCELEQDAPIDADITIFYTNDEHGWIEETEHAAGAAKLMGLWKDKEGHTPDDGFLILSGGDNWTGPAISTWFKGESTIEVMNAMGYDAAAIGNHEFDFTVDGMKARIQQATFPYLSANMRLRGTDSIPDFIQAYTIQEVNGIQVGIVGLTTTSTYYSAFPAFVSDFDFIDYATALEEIVPKIWDDGAELVLCIAHICFNEMQALVPTAESLGISMIGGGHCNELEARIIHEDLALIVGGWRMANYARLDIAFSMADLSVIDMQAQTSSNQNGSPDPAIESIVSFWQEETEEALGEVVGHASSEISQYSPEMYNLVTDSWLAKYTEADIAVTNAGGIRQSIVKGGITKGDIVGVLPFDNNILELKLTGAEVIDCIGSNLILGGMTTTNGYRHTDGTPLKADSIYSVLTTDYLYIQDATNFHLYDSNPYYTGLNYHQPTVDYILALGTSASKPLNNYLDYDARR